MRKIYFSFLFLLSTFSLSLAQNNAFVISDPSIKWQLAECLPGDSTWLFCGTNGSSLIWARSDYMGTIVKSTHLPLSAQDILEHVTRIQGNEVIASIKAEKSFSIVHMDSEGNVKKFHSYSIPFIPTIYNVHIYPSAFKPGYWITGSGYSPSYGLMGFILKTDTSGNILQSRLLKSKYHGSSSITFSPDIALEGDANSCYFAASRLSRFECQEGGCIFKMDSLLNVKWSIETFYNGRGFKGEELAHTGNNFILTWGTGSGFVCGQPPTQYPPELNVWVFDSAGFVTRKLKIPTGINHIYSNSIRKTSDSGFIISATVGNGGLYFRPMALKILPSMKLDWAKIYGPIPAYYAGTGFYSSRQTPDQGYIMAGSHRVKTDSKGESGCLVETLNFTSTLDESIYPPDNNITIETDTLTVIRKTNTQLSQAIAITSTYYCYTGIENKNKYTSEIVISPNPSPGKFQINLPEVNHPYDLEMYNSLGKLILKKNVVANSEVDLTNHAKGIYFLKICSNEKIISTGKIIIQ